MKYSIVMPTLPEKDYLFRMALQTAEWQDFDDFEVVTRVNSTGLNIMDSWQKAFDKASGEFVMMLPDDDALRKDALSLIDMAITQTGADACFFMNSWYGHPTVEPQRRGQMRFDGRPWRNSWHYGHYLLRQFYKFAYPIPAPLYCCFRRDMFDRGLKFYGRFPDYGLAASVMHLSGRVAVLAEPILVHGYCTTSDGEKSLGHGKRHEWPIEDGRSAVFEHAPLSGHLFINAWYETLARVKADLGFDAPIGMLEYYHGYARNLETHTWYWDTGELIDEFENHLVGKPVLQQTMQLLSKVKQLHACKPWEYDYRFATNIWLNGQDYGVESIVDMARHLEHVNNKFREIQAIKSHLQEK